MGTRSKQHIVIVPQFVECISGAHIPVISVSLAACSSPMTQALIIVRLAVSHATLYCYYLRQWSCVTFRQTLLLFWVEFCRLGKQYVAIPRQTRGSLLHRVASNPEANVQH
jgi:hypothetical protein